MKKLIFLISILAIASFSLYNPTALPNGIRTNIISGDTTARGSDGSLQLRGSTINIYGNTIYCGSFTVTGDFTASVKAITVTTITSNTSYSGGYASNGTVTASYFVGDGSKLTNIPGATGNISLTGNISAVNGTFFGTVSSSAFVINGQSTVNGVLTFQDPPWVTFTPTFNSVITYNTYVGRYQLIGKKVNIKIECTAGTAGAGTASGIKIGGLPFPIANPTPLALLWGIGHIATAGTQSYIQLSYLSSTEAYVAYSPYTLVNGDAVSGANRSFEFNGWYYTP